MINATLPGERTIFEVARERRSTRDDSPKAEVKVNTETADQDEHSDEEVKLWEWERM